MPCATLWRCVFLITHIAARLKEQRKNASTAQGPLPRYRTLTHTHLTPLTIPSCTHTRLRLALESCKSKRKYAQIKPFVIYGNYKTRQVLAQVAANSTLWHPLAPALHFPHYCCATLGSKMATTTTTTKQNIKRQIQPRSPRKSNPKCSYLQPAPSTTLAPPVRLKGNWWHSQCKKMS